MNLQRLIEAAATAICLLCYLPVNGQEIRVAIPNKIETMDPLKSEIVQERFLMPLVYESLFQVRNDGEFLPGLVKSWSMDPKSKRLVLELHEDRKFEDGSPLTVADAIASLNELCAPKSRAAAAFFTLPDCGKSTSAFRTEGANKISVRINSGVNFALGNLAYSRALVYRRKGQRILSAGRFRYELIEGGGIVLYPNKFAPQSESYPSAKISFQFVAEHSLLSSTGKKEFDIYAMYLSSPVNEALERTYQTIVHSPFITQTLVLNPKAIPNAPRASLSSFRSALKTLQLTRCTPGTYDANGIIPLGILGSRTPDLTRKKFEASVKSISETIKITLHRHVEKRSECEEKAISELGRKFGLEIGFAYSDKYESLFKTFRNPRTQGYIELFSFSSKDPSNILRRFSNLDPDNLFHFKSSAIGALLKRAWESDSSQARKTFYLQIQDMIEKESFVVPLYYVGHHMMLRKCIDLRGDGKWRNHPNPFYLFLEQEIGISKC